MAASLVPCSSCARHVRSSEEVCPFCRAVVTSASPRPSVSAETRRLTRVAFALAGATALAGCGKETAAPADAAPEVAIAYPPYGQPMIPDPPPVLADAALEPAVAAPPYGQPMIPREPRRADAGAGKDAGPPTK